MAHPLYGKSAQLLNIDNAPASKANEDDSMSPDLKMCDKIAKQLINISIRTKGELDSLMESAEKFLRNQWKQNKFQPVKHLPLSKWYLGLRINFYSLCNMRDINSRWFRCEDSHRSPLYPRKIQTLSLALMLLAVSGVRDDILLDMIDETIWNTDTTGALFVKYLQVDSMRSWYSILAYKKVEEMKELSISYTTMFLILMHQLEYKHHDLLRLFPIDPVMDEFFAVAMKHISINWTSFKIECGQFRLRIKHWAQNFRTFCFYDNGNGFAAAEYFNVYKYSTEAPFAVAFENGASGVARNVPNCLKGEFTSKKLADCLRTLSYCLYNLGTTDKGLIELLRSVAEKVAHVPNNFARYEIPIPRNDGSDDESSTDKHGEVAVGFQSKNGGVRVYGASGDNNIGDYYAESSDDSNSNTGKSKSPDSCDQSGNGLEMPQTSGNPFDHIILTSDEDDSDSDSPAE